MTMDTPEAVDSEQQESPDDVNDQQQSPAPAEGAEGEVIIETRSLTKVYRDFWGRPKVRPG